MNRVEHLIVSSTLDYSSDLVCCEFERRGLSYFRINRDQFSLFKISYSLSNETLYIEHDKEKYIISSDTLKSIYFRAPVFLRETNKHFTLDEQVYRSQWSSFIRNLIVFHSAKWLNHPVETYKAENKLFQLHMAIACGLNVPSTHIANTQPENIKEDSLYIVKSLDTALFRLEEQELFTYSLKITGKDLLQSNLNLAPVIIQDYLNNKLDIRATIVGDSIFAVSISKEGNPIDGDWRKSNKDNLTFAPIELPISLRQQIHRLMDELGLSFGGMDLAVINNVYYFIEVNPTGEWGWLSTSTKLPIEKAIVDYLSE